MVSKGKIIGAMAGIALGAASPVFTEGVQEEAANQAYGPYAQSYPIEAADNGSQDGRQLYTFEVPGNHPLNDGRSFEYAINNFGDIYRTDRPDLTFKISGATWRVNPEQEADFVRNGGLIEMSPEFVGALDQAYRQVITDLSGEIVKLSEEGEESKNDLTRTNELYAALLSQYEELNSQYARIEEENDRTIEENQRLRSELEETIEPQAPQETQAEDESKSGFTHSTSSINAGTNMEWDPARGYFVGPSAGFAYNAFFDNEGMLGFDLNASAAFATDKGRSLLYSENDPSPNGIIDSVSTTMDSAEVYRAALNFRAGTNGLYLSAGPGIAIRRSTDEEVSESIRNITTTLRRNTTDLDTLLANLEFSGAVGYTSPDNGWGIEARGTVDTSGRWSAGANVSIGLGAKQRNREAE